MAWIALSSLRPMRREEDLLAAGRGVEPPGAVLAHERDWERPVLVAEDEDGLVRAFHHHLMLGIVGLDDPIAVRPIGNVVAGGHDVGGIRA